MQFDQNFPFDRAKAKALLAQAGWTPGPDGILQKGGQKLTLNWIAQRGRYPKDGEITEAVQQMWKEVGVDAKVEFREWATVFNESLQAGLGPAQLDVRLGHDQRRRRLLALRPVPLDAGRPDRLEPDAATTTPRWTSCWRRPGGA